MIVSINQPAYLPWLGYFDRIAASDAHVVLDHVQFEKNSFVNRNRIRTATGQAWLTVPVLTAGRFGALPIDELEIDEARDWRRKHWQTISQSYSRAPHFAAHAPFFDELYGRAWLRLLDLCTFSNSYLLRSLGIETELHSSRSLAVEGAKSDLALAICRELGATVYLSGALGRAYLDERGFEQAGIEVRYQDYRHPEYAQLHSPFVPYLAAVDLLLNCGPESAAVMRRGRGDTR